MEDGSTVTNTTKLHELMLEPDFESVGKYVAQINDGDLQPVSSATLIVNYRGTKGPVGLIEDVWTHEEYRKRGLASRLVLRLIELAKELGCYKVNLSCADHNINFYKSLGFEVYQNNMRINL